MGFYERLLDIEKPRIPVHTFYAAMAEFKRGQVTQSQVIAMFGLSASEQTEIASLIQRVNTNQLTGLEIHDVLLLAESRLVPYDSVQAVKTRFGV